MSWSKEKLGIGLHTAKKNGTEPPNRLLLQGTPLCWKSNNPSAQAPWRNYLPYESMAKSECFCQNRIALTLWPFLQINPEKMTSLQMCRIKKITPCSIQTFWDRQLCFYVKKLFVSEKTQKNELCHFSMEIYVTNFAPRAQVRVRPRQNLMTQICYEKWLSSLFCVFSITNNSFT